MKVTNFSQAIDDAIELLGIERYRSYKEVVKISEKLMTQARLFELFSLGETKDSIADAVGLDEKTIRFQRDSDQASFKSYVALTNYLKKVKRRRRAKS